MRKHNIIFSVLLIVFVILINIVTSYIDYSFDLTKDNIHSLSNTSIDIISSLDDKIFIKVYLEGEFPAEFKHLSNSAYSLLKRFKDYSDLIDFQFIDPNKDDNQENNKNLFQQLVKQGLMPTDLEIRKTGSLLNKIIFPGAIIYYKDKNIAVNFLKNKFYNSTSQNINLSIENLEYEFVSAILKITSEKRDKIAFLKGNDELDKKEVYDITYSVLNDNFSLNNYFDIDWLNIKEFQIDSNTMQADISNKIYNMNAYKTIIIANPSNAFNNLDKFLIDQYIMNGGKVLWLIDGVEAEMSKLKDNPEGFIAKRNDLNISDQLFKYGVRINSNLIQDKRAVEIPIVTGYSNNIPQQDFFSWPYFPLLKSISAHPISRGLDAIKCNFVSSIDTIENNINKTILLASSNQSRVVPAPININLNILQQPNVSTYNDSYPIAVLLEGKFESVFKNRILPKENNISFRQSSDENKMIVISDGDLIANEVSEKGTVYPLGYDKFINYTYEGNKHFLINCVEYLCDNNGVSILKAKELKLRLLNKTLIAEYYLYIQIINILTPLLLLFIFGIIYKFNYLRKYV